VQPGLSERKATRDIMSLCVDCCDQATAILNDGKVAKILEIKLFDDRVHEVIG
jgi:hypothetical protein